MKHLQNLWRNIFSNIVTHFVCAILIQVMTEIQLSKVKSGKKVLQMFDTFGNFITNVHVND